MKNEPFVEGLRKIISARVSFARIVTTLREYRRQGMTRHEVQSALDALRERAQDEATEDRILEVMDIVSGFCPREATVWDD